MKNYQFVEVIKAIVFLVIFVGVICSASLLTELLFNNLICK